MKEEFNFLKGLEAKEKGMSKVLGSEPPDFMYCYTQFVINLPHGTLLQNEDIRKVWGGPWPHHHNCWGAAWKSVISACLIERTDIEVHMTAVKSHARRTFLYRRT